MKIIRLILIYIDNMWKKYKSLIQSLLAISLLIAVPVIMVVSKNKPEELMTGASNYIGSKWTTISNFNGYQTKVDPSKVPNGANPNGQNTTANDGDRISIRDLGYEIFPEGSTASTSDNTITSLHNFRRRDGENIMIRAYGTVLEYLNEANDTWETLLTGLSDGAIFDFADYNINTDLISYTYFGNAVDDFSRWTGVNTLTDGALAIGDSSIIVDDIDGFKLGSSTIIVCGTELSVDYASTTISTIYLTGTSTIACADNRSVAEAVQTYDSLPKGNIYLVDSNRLFIAGVASTTQAIFFSAYGNAVTFASDLITDSTDTSGGIFNLGEGGGGVIDMAADESSIYFFKQSTIRKATLNDTLYTLGVLKPFDGKSQTVGLANGSKSFTGGNGIFFTTPDNQIMNLSRVEQVDYPQVIPISDIIEPTVAGFKLNKQRGIVFRDRAYFTVKASSDSMTNDTVLIFNIKAKQWDSPVVGWNVAEFVIYDDGTSEELYWGDAISPNMYRVVTEARDGEFEVVANWRSKQFDFGLPHAQKEVLDVYLDGYITQNTTLEVSLLLDEDGYTQSFTHNITGMDDDIIYDSDVFNSIGLSAFGTNRFGSQEDISGKKKFRIYLGSNFRASPFYTLQIDFASDGESQDWEILNFGFKWRPYTTPENRNLYQQFQ